MKKNVILLFVIFLSITLCACDPGTYVIDKEYLLDNVVNIELVNYENPNQKSFESWVPNHFNDLVDLNLNDLTIIESLDLNKNIDFIDAFSETDILHTYYAYNSPAYVCIKLNYNNGNFLIIWANYIVGSFGGYIGEYTATGEVLSFWGSFSGLFYYTDLVNGYFNYKIDNYKA